MNQVIFNTTEANRISEEIKSLKCDLDKILNYELIEEMNELSKIWKSNTANEFCNKFLVKKNQFIELCKTIDYMAEVIKKSSLIMNQSDQNIIL